MADFWETVERQVYERKDTVRRVVFDFPDPYEAGPADASPGELERLHLIASLSRATGAAKASLKMEATRKGTLLLDRTKEDLVRMVSLCCANGYGISVYFRQMGLYRYGKEACAIYEIGESLINDFANGQRTLGSGAGEAYALTERLDYIREQTKDYGDAKKTGRKGNRKHRRAV